MIFSKKTWLIILGITLTGFLLNALHISEYSLDVFGYGLAVGFVLSILHDRMGYLKQSGEYYDDLERVLSHFYTVCFVTKDIDEEHTQALIESIESRVQEFKRNLERRINKK